MWINTNGRNNLEAYAGLLDTQVDYEYVKGRLASRNEVLNDFEKNIKRWPIRSYSVKGNQFTWADLGDKATISFSMDYHYSDLSGRQAKGVTNINLLVRRSGGGWVISSYKETVDRKRNDKKGM
ncbi:MAG: hypothetical protein KDN05_07945 [Verrucomicrobiae bacterium]|nr:hypothetical protein [Verrucomicrobiae bacterium]